MSFWRKDEPVLDENGAVIAGGMWPTQRSCWESKSYIKAFVGGYGSGKSTILAKRTIASALYNSPIPILLVSPSYRMARRTIIPAITHLLTGRKLKYEHRRQDAVIKVTYRGRTGEIWIGSADTPDSLKGSNVAACYLDEAFLVDYSAIEIMLSRIRDPNARLRELFMVGTPEGVSNWGYEIVEGSLRDKFDISVHRASTLENKALPREFIEALLSGYDEKTRRAYVDGEFVDMSGDKALYAFDKSKNVKSLPLPDGLPICAGIDFNYNPFCACLLWIQREHDFPHEGPHIHIFKEIKLEGGADTAEMVRRLWYESGQKLDVFYPDPSGRQHKTSAVGGVTDITIIQNMGKELRGYPFKIRARRRTPSIRDRYNAANNMLENGSLTIDPSCENIIKSFMLHAYGKKYHGEDLSHFVDCSTYVVELENPVISKIDKQRERWY